MRFRLSSLCSVSCTLLLVAGSARAAIDGAHLNGASTTLGIPNAEPSDGWELLARAATVNQARYATLESFVCSEVIERYKGRLGSRRVRHLDTVSAKVSLESGTERYSDVRQKNRSIQDLAKLDGAWSEGEFGSLLGESEQLLRTQSAVIDGAAELDGVPAVMLHFDVAADDSSWDLTVGGQHYFVSFRTRVWLSKATGDILKIVRTSTNIPSGLRIAQIDWSVTLSPVEFDGRRWLLPSTGEYQVLYQNTGWREWNTLQFRDYHRYGAEVKLRFN